MRKFNINKLTEEERTRMNTLEDIEEATYTIYERVKGEKMEKVKISEVSIGKDRIEIMVCNNKKVVTILRYVMPDGEQRFSRGIAICSKEDTFDLEFGRALSMKRALNHKSATYNAWIFAWNEKQERTFKIGDRVELRCVKEYMYLSNNNNRIGVVNSVGDKISLCVSLDGEEYIRFIRIEDLKK